MRWIPDRTDRTGRFRARPFYTRDELDHICEERVGRFLRGKYETVRFPLDTNDLTILLEQDVDDLDLYADLSAVGGEECEVEGVTIFVPGRRPRVRIARALMMQPRREPRLRTTLAHELGHATLHAFAGRPDLTTRPLPRGDQSCLAPAWGRSPVANTRGVSSDWMEWQAAYASGAFLVPRRALQQVVGPRGGRGAARASSPVGERLIRQVQEHFGVSQAAARVRLLQLHHLAESTAAPPGPS